MAKSLNTNAIDIIITKAMLQLGFSPALNGFYFLRDAIKIACKDSESLTLITKLIYAPLAKSYKTTSKNIEKSIRLSSEFVWNSNKSSDNSEPKNITVLNNIYTFSSRRPENRELIALISGFVKNSGEIFDTDISKGI